MVMWDEVINEVSLEFPDVELDHMLGVWDTGLVINPC